MASSPHNLPLLSRFTTLNDAARLRMLRLLDREELSVGELARSLQLPQSTVSRHLKLLHEGHWVMKRAEGTASLYRLSSEGLETEARALWSLARGQLGASPTFDQDDARLAEVLAERRTDSKSFFGRVGGEWDRLRRELFGDSFTAEALLGLVKSETVIADLGCGTGDAAEHLAPFVKKVIAVDREQAMLDAARKRLAGHSNVEFRRGELTDLPLKNGEVDAALVFLVMQHIEEPEPAVAEISRTLKPGGVLLIVDLRSHDRESYRHTMGHRHMGFDERTIKLWARHAGMSDVRYRRLRPDTHARGPALFVATMRK
jgi:ArsR family transcriptional regulator